MTAAPDDLPAPSDRSGWQRLARLAESSGGPEGWKVHRPGLGTYGLGLAVFGVLGGVCLAVVVLDGASVCPLAGSILFLALAAYCLVVLLLSPRNFLLITPDWLLMSRPIAAPVRLAWDEIVSIDMRTGVNPRGSRETFGVVSIRLRGDRRIRIDAYDVDHLKVVHEDLLAHHGRPAPGDSFGSSR